ncbi:MAG: SDR family NAD(P)-dependent oxidoreductase [Myxococcota bacterium]
MGCLQGKVAVITGAGRGIGRAVAERFAAEGARLVLNDSGCDREGEGNDDTVVQAAVDAVRAAGGEARGDAGDLRDPAVARRLVATAREAYGRLDCAVGCAGIRRDGSIRKLSAADLGRILEAHVHASFALVQGAVEAFIDQGEGGAVVLSSGPLAFFGSARRTAAAAAEGAVTAMVRSAAVELRRHRIRVNALVPTARTRLTEDLPLFQGVTADSMGPHHVAPLAAYLASDLAADVSGEVLGVAGGRAYAVRCRETTGAFVEGRPFTPEEIATRLDEIVRGG